MLVFKTFCQFELFKKSHVFLLFFFVFLRPLSPHTFKIFYFWPDSIFFIILSTQVSFFNHYLRLKHFLIFLKVARVSVDISPVTATQPNKKWRIQISHLLLSIKDNINEYSAVNGRFWFCYKIISSSLYNLYLNFVFYAKLGLVLISVSLKRQSTVSVSL